MQEDIKKLDVYSEEFISIFELVLEKFVEEYDDMQYRQVIQKAYELKQAIDEL